MGGGFNYVKDLRAVIDNPKSITASRESIKVVQMCRRGEIYYH